MKKLYLAAALSACAVIVCTTPEIAPRSIGNKRAAIEFLREKSFPIITGCTHGGLMAAFPSIAAPAAAISNIAAYPIWALSGIGGPNNDIENCIIHVISTVATNFALFMIRRK